MREPPLKWRILEQETGSFLKL